MKNNYNYNYKYLQWSTYHFYKSYVDLKFAFQSNVTPINMLYLLTQPHTTDENLRLGMVLVLLRYSFRDTRTFIY